MYDRHRVKAIFTFNCLPQLFTATTKQSTINKAVTMVTAAVMDSSINFPPHRVLMPSFYLYLADSALAPRTELSMPREFLIAQYC